MHCELLSKGDTHTFAERQEMSDVYDFISSDFDLMFFPFRAVCDIFEASFSHFLTKGWKDSSQLF